MILTLAVNIRRSARKKFIVRSTATVSGSCRAARISAPEAARQDQGVGHHIGQRKQHRPGHAAPGPQHVLTGVQPQPPT
jgi:hypothetical protein